MLLSKNKRLEKQAHRKKRYFFKMTKNKNKTSDKQCWNETTRRWDIESHKWCTAMKITAWQSDDEDRERQRKWKYWKMSRDHINVTSGILYTASYGNVLDWCSDNNRKKAPKVKKPDVWEMRERVWEQMPPEKPTTNVYNNNIYIYVDRVSRQNKMLALNDNHFAVYIRKPEW